MLLGNTDGEFLDGIPESSARVCADVQSPRRKHCDFTGGWSRFPVGLVACNSRFGGYRVVDVAARQGARTRAGMPAVVQRREQLPRRRRGDHGDDERRRSGAKDAPRQC